ncbi:TIGR03943 family protein [Streptomyces sp. SID3343]|uniref:TIGR03943 family putative permease subunit n=1 Tax=Streptomyces sp. SID3343 TaxID=2690260 RepID=UPI0013680F54|nr:TIGR03943 family protein [Streptomyces sp. SID3343]
MRRDVQAVVLILIGGALLRISLTDMYLRYVKEGLRPALIAAGVILFLVGLIAAVRDGIQRRDEATEVARATASDGGGSPGDDGAHDGGHEDRPGHLETPDGGHDRAHDDGHGHDHASGPRAAWLLCLPVLALFLIAPPALGSYTASRSDNVVAKPAAASSDAGFPALPPGDPLPMTLADFLIRSVWDTAAPLKDRNVQLTGFVTPGRNGGWYVTRMVISCCAADAFARKVEVHGAPAPPADSWVQVTGKWLPNGQLQSDDAMPALTATTVERIPEPKDTYE